MLQTLCGRDQGSAAMAQDEGIQAIPPAGCRDGCSLLELISLCLFLYGSKGIVLPSGAGLCYIFLGNFNTKIKWADVFGLLFLVVVTMGRLFTSRGTGKQCTVFSFTE